MTTLWLMLIGMLLLAFSFVFLPLLRMQKATPLVSEQAQNIAIFKDRLSELEAEHALGTLDPALFLSLKTELETSLLADVEGHASHELSAVNVHPKHWLIAGVMGCFIVLTSSVMYAQLGRSADFSQFLGLQETQRQEAIARQQTQTKLIQLVEILKQKIAQNPQDAEKWHLLANSYAAMQQYSQAAQIYQTAMQALGKAHPEYATLKGSYAQMLFQAADEQITPAVMQAVQETLAIDPQESSALLLRGIEAYTRQDIRGAIAFWQQAKIKASPQLISTFIAPIIVQAQAQLAQQTPVLRQAKMLVQVRVADEIKSKISPEQTVFVFARPVGGKMPLAIEKLQVKDLPATVVLDDSKAAMPSARLSSVQQVDIVARISSSGRAEAQQGDRFAQQSAVPVTENPKPITLMIQ